MSTRRGGPGWMSREAVHRALGDAIAEVRDRLGNGGC